MFKIKVLKLILCVFLLCTTHSMALAQNTTQKCYGKGEQVIDSTKPCCEGLKQFTEQGTNKVFCDAEIDKRNRTYLWISILLFPALLLIFIIFGIRNKMVNNKHE